MAITGGGHVEAGKVYGGAYLRSEGGHVKVVSVEKWAELRTVGGNIYLQRTGGKVLVESGGGQINLGEVAGAVQARTAGGGIQIARVSGPTNIETAGGSIYLKQVLNTVNANTGSGQITAWFANTGSTGQAGTSQLVCGEGDIVVYLPREIALSIEATIEAASEHQIIAPQFELQKTWVRTPGGPRVLQAKGLLNGGGKLLKLRTVAGNIKLVRVDGAPVVVAPSQPPSPPAESADKFTWRQRMEHRLRGRIQVNSEVQATRLAHKVDPKYPERARKEGVEGWVWLHTLIDENGAVEELYVISGHPWLAEAAAEAVRQWRYRPTLLDGKPARVETVVKVMFTLK
jgi:TonB family protein